MKIVVKVDGETEFFHGENIRFEEELINKEFILDEYNYRLIIRDGEKKIAVFKDWDYVRYTN